MAIADLPTVAETLAANRYPGRGLVAARTADGELTVTYFLTGRSPASQDRVLRIQGEDLVVVPSGDVEFDALRHYAAVKREGEWTVIGNGDQVAHIAAQIGEGHDLLDAVADVDYEPDPPICTSRITVLVRGERVWLHAARRSRADRTTTDSMLVRLGAIRPGEAALLTTYESDGEHVATATPYQEARTEAASPESLLDEVWGALDEGLRVAAVAITPTRPDRYAANRAR